MEPAVTMALVGVFSRLTAWDVLETRGSGGASRRAPSPLFGWRRSPWQVESPAAAGGQPV